jgi:hypothetical protein
MSRGAVFFAFSDRDGDCQLTIDDFRLGTGDKGAIHYLEVGYLAPDF